MAAGQRSYRFRRIVLALLACLPVIASAVVPEFLPHVWTKQQGLPDDSVNAVLQTRDGYLWVGTAAGLARFDGMRFVSFAPTSEKTNTQINVTALCEDSTGRLWIGTQGDGLLCYLDGVVSKFHHDGNPLDQTINSIAEDAAGNIWLGAPSGLYRLEDHTLTSYTTNDGLPNNFVSSVHVARSGTNWITTRGGICYFKDGHIFPYPISFLTDSPGRNPESLGVYEDRKGNQWAFGDTYLVNLKVGKHLNHFASGDTTTTSMRIWALCEGRHGELWIGTSGKELYCFADNNFIPITLPNGGLTSDVRALCEDSEGNLWLGTYGGGLVRLQPRNVRVVDASTGLPNRPAVCLAFNEKGQAWFGFERDGLYTQSGKNYERIDAGGSRDFLNLVSSICTAPDSSLWVGTPGAGLYRVTDHDVVHYTTANGLADDNITAVGVDSTGAIWAGTAAGELNRIIGDQIKRFGADDGLSDQPVTAIIPAHDGGIWAGYGNGRIFRGENGSFHQIAARTATAGKPIRSLYEDASTNLWIGTTDGRLVCQTEGHFLNWNLVPVALDDHSIIGILSSDDGDLWFSTRTAIYRLAQHDITSLLAEQSAFRPQQVYKADDSASPAPSRGWPQAAKSPDGKLWFGLASAVVSLDLRAPMGDFTIPPVLIEEVTANEKALPLRAFRPATDKARDPARLPSELRSLDIQFTALNLSAPEKIRFRHRLDGFDADWVVDNTGVRKVPYGRLPYGTYTFRVQAGTADESWFEPGASFHFVVPTPLWRTSWALALYIFVTVLLIAVTARSFFNRRLRRKLEVLAAQQAMERERMRIAKDMHDEIGSKLTKISFMSERASGELQGQDSVARKLFSIAHTSRDLLQTLDEIVWAVNPHNDTLEHLANYLGQYATEYLQNTAVDCELHIPSGLPEHPFSAETRHNIFLAFEEALNNALKHGRATLVRIDMMFEPAQFQIKIVDNGCGFDVTTNGSPAPAAELTSGGRGGNGLRNMTQRLAETGGKCIIASQPGKGTTVCFSVPLQTAGAAAKRK